MTITKVSLLCWEGRKGLARENSKDYLGDGLRIK